MMVPRSRGKAMIAMKYRHTPPMANATLNQILSFII